MTKHAVQIRLGKAELDYVDGLAKAWGVTRAEAVVRALFLLAQQAQQAQQA